MKRVLGLLAATTLVVTAGVVTTGSAGAQATTTPVVALVQNIELPPVLEKGHAATYVVHGLNLDGQSAQGDGGTAVTVCAGGDQLLTDFQFGDIAGPVDLPWGAVIPIDVYVGADVACGSATPVISQTVTVPEEPSISLVATAGPDGAVAAARRPRRLDARGRAFSSSLTPARTLPRVTIPITRLPPRCRARRRAGQVTVSVDGTDAGELSFGESLFADLPNGTYSVEVTLGGTPIVGPADIDVPPCTLTVVYVVGNQPIAARAGHHDRSGPGRRRGDRRSRLHRLSTRTPHHLNERRRPGTQVPGRGASGVSSRGQGRRGPPAAHRRASGRGWPRTCPPCAAP